jgi:replicative DNA helicase
MNPRTPLYRLKRRARETSRAEKVPLHAALDCIASEEGFGSWSLLAAADKHRSPARTIYGQLKPGELLLTGARPGQGKTLLSLQLAVEAIRAGHKAHFFSLEYTLLDVMDRLRALGVEPQTLRDNFIFDDSDDISAGYVIERLADAPGNSLAVIDYLQLLDQRRDKPDLARQVAALRAFARRKSLVMVFISQIDRTFEASSKSLPGLEDVRLPNSLDLSLFDKACFLGGGEMRLVVAG